QVLQNSIIFICFRKVEFGNSSNAVIDICCEFYFSAAQTKCVISLAAVSAERCVIVDLQKSRNTEVKVTFDVYTVFAFLFGSRYRVLVHLCLQLIELLLQLLNTLL